MSHSISTLFWNRKAKKDVPFATSLSQRFRTRFRRQSWSQKNKPIKLWRQVTLVYPLFKEAIRMFRPKTPKAHPNYQPQKLTPKLRKILVVPWARRLKSTYYNCLLCLFSSATILKTNSSQFWSSCGKIFRRNTATKWKWSLETCVSTEWDGLKKIQMCNASS